MKFEVANDDPTLCNLSDWKGTQPSKDTQTL